MAEGTQASASTAFRSQGLKLFELTVDVTLSEERGLGSPCMVRKQAQTGGSALQTVGTRDSILTCPQEEGDTGLARRHGQDIWAEETTRKGWI